MAKIRTSPENCSCTIVVVEMLLFAFSLILAGGAVALTAFLGIGPGFLQEMLMYSVAAVLGAAGFLGLLIALIERGQTKKREARLQALREGPSSLQLAPPMPEPLPEPPPAPVVEVPAPAPTPAPAPVAAVRAPVEVPEAPQTPLPTIDDHQHEELQSATTAPVVEPEEDIPAPVPARDPADQLLHLDPEYELSEVKRVLRIWQMTLNEDRVYNELASWSAQDGTQIDLVESDEGQPILEIRGPMAQELAEFLPQDLPVHPVAFSD